MIFTVTQGNYCEMIAANFAMLSAILMSLKRVNGVKKNMTQNFF